MRARCSYSRDIRIAPRRTFDWISAGREVRVSSKDAIPQLAPEARCGEAASEDCGREDTRTDRPRDVLERRALVGGSRFERNVDLQPVARNDCGGKYFASLALELGRVARVASGDVREHELLHAGLGRDLGRFARC